MTVPLARRQTPTPFQCPECKGYFGNFAGLNRHRHQTHGVDLDKEKQAKPKPDKPQTKAKPGPHKCPECPLTFDTPQNLGKHRRFTHNVFGRSFAAKTMQAKKAAHTPAPTPAPAPVQTAQRFKCPECERSFTDVRALSVHRRFTHGIEGKSTEAARQREKTQTKALTKTKTALTPSTPTELTNGNGRTQGPNHHQTPTAKTGDSYRNDAAFAQISLAIAHTVGVIENIIGTASFRYDVAPREFAKRIILSLGEHYSS